MLAKRIKNIDEVIDQYILELKKQIRVDQVILFGSYGRGTPRDYSDIDLVVVSPDFEGGTEKDYLILDRAARKINCLIEAIPYNRNDFQDHETGDFLDEIQKTGRIIYKKAA